MRKYIMFLGGLVIGAMLMLTSSAVADSITKVINATFNSNLTVTLDGKPVTLEKGSINYKDTNYLSVREVAKISGLDINWNEKTKTVEIKTVAMNDSEQKDGTEKSGNHQEDEIASYLSLAEGAEKYGIDKRTINFDPKEKSISFMNTNIKIYYLDNFDLDCDGYKKDGITYIKEDFFIEAKKQIENNH